MKEVARLNIPPIYLTLDTFQLLSGWLKEVAPQNIPHIDLTLDRETAADTRTVSDPL